MRLHLQELLGRREDDDEVADIIRRLGSPKISEDVDRSYYEFPASGLSLMFGADSRLAAVHFYSQGRDGYSQYRGQLPQGLTFLLRQRDVIERLGLPESSGGGGRSILYRAMAPWLRYLVDDYVLHAEFDPVTGKISLVTLSLRGLHGH
jgi:hypothetical protein